MKYRGISGRMSHYSAVPEFNEFPKLLEEYPITQNLWYIKLT